MMPSPSAARMKDNRRGKYPGPIAATEPGLRGQASQKANRATATKTIPTMKSLRLLIRGMSISPLARRRASAFGRCPGRASELDVGSVHHFLGCRAPHAQEGSKVGGAAADGESALGRELVPWSSGLRSRGYCLLHLLDDLRWCAGG